MDAAPPIVASPGFACSSRRVLQRLSVAIAAVLSPQVASADDLTCMPAILCIDGDCQSGHDARLALTLRDWTAAHPVLVSDFGEVVMTGGKGGDPMTWTGKNAEGQKETLTVGRAALDYSHVVRMDASSTVGRLTDTGTCKVTK